MKDIFKLEIDPNRIFGLDILRALAILFVVIGHSTYLLPQKWSKVIEFFVFDGVQIFFVLSGFLIGGILIKIIEKNGVSKSILFNFWIRRWFRTLPNYFLILLLLCFLHFFFTDGFHFRSVGRYFVFSQNLYQEQPSWFFPEAWSLSVEEWFYISAPIVVFILALKTTPKKAILFTSVIFIVLITSIRYYRHVSIPVNSLDEWDSLYRKQVITRLDSLMFGVLGAYFNFYYQKQWLRNKLPLLFCGIILFLLSKFIIPGFTTINGIYSTTFCFTLISFATLLLVPYLCDLKSGKGFVYQAITYVSLTSYSMYLLNLSVIQYWIINKIHWGGLMDNSYLILITKYSLYWILVISLSILLYKYFEISMTGLRDRIKQKKRQ
jgi:peptidoglycan/LPS O-acetylase OafA/YrhL